MNDPKGSESKNEVKDDKTTEQESTITNKGITYLVIIFLLLSLCFQVAIKSDEEGRVHWNIATRDIPPETSLVYLGLIGSAAAIPMDKIAIFLGRFLSGGGK